MRPILLGPFGSMGSMNMKLKNICVEDLTLETVLLCVAIVRVLTADTYYESIGAWGAVLSASSIATTLCILVVDGGIQCMCCRKKPLCTSLCFGCYINGTDIISDKTLMKLLLLVTQLGILSAILTVLTEICTFFDSDEVRRHVVKMPRNEYGLNDYMEWHHAIAMIIVQMCISIPWRLYVYQVTSGVLHAIHCVEVLNFRSAYSGDALRKLLPDTGAAFRVELANEGDVAALARLYCEGFQELFAHIGLPRDAGPSIIEAQWRSFGTLTVRRWLGRVGVVRDDNGAIVGALSLQLPGDTAAYASLSRESSVDTYNPLDMDVSTSSFAGEGYMHKIGRVPVGDVETQQPDRLSLEDNLCGCAVGTSQMGIVNALRFRYKHAIVNDHVCTPGEAYVDFLCVKESAQREGVGSRLMQWAEVSVERLGCGRIALSVWGSKEKNMLFYGNLGYEQTNDRTDPVSYCIVQTSFCWKNRFYDFEKSLGQSKGLAIRSAKYGFTSDLVSDQGSTGDLMTSVHGLFSGVGSLSMNRGFLMTRGGGGVSAVPSSMADSEDQENIRSSHGLLGSQDLFASSRHGLVSKVKQSGKNSDVETGDVERQQSAAVGCTTGLKAERNTTSHGEPQVRETPHSQQQLPVVPFGHVEYAKYSTE